MKLETVAAAQAYQGSVPKAASTPKTAKRTQAVSETSAPKAVSMPKAVNPAGQSVMLDALSAPKAEEGSRIVKWDTDSEDGSERTIIFDADEQRDIPENAHMQQNNKQIQEAVEKLKEKMSENTEAIFGIHEGTNRVMIKIVDKETKDVLKEFPPEKTLDMIQKVWEMAGIMVDEKL